MKKYEYIIYTFKLEEVRTTEEWINRKSEIGFKVINIHYYDIDTVPYVRYTLQNKIH